MAFNAYPPASMPTDYELYTAQEQQHLEYLPQTQPFLPPASYGMDSAFSGAYEAMSAITEESRPQDLQFHYDAIAQGVKAPFQAYNSPAASPHSTSNSFQDQPPILSASSESGASVSSSAMGSPSLNHEFAGPWNPMANGLAHPTGFEFPGLMEPMKLSGCVDPTLVQFGNPLALGPPSPFADMPTTHSPFFGMVEHPPSPALSQASSHGQRPGSQHIKRGSQSPSYHEHRFQPYPSWTGQPRRRSDASQQSQASRKSSSFELDDDSREKGLCPLPECGRVFKDLKAHMLTHLNERPEKCPITTCEYHLKGFARKYDKNRHTLTHYKGTMVCGFCPGSGSAAEKSFNRADVFKRHLTSVHHVEQNPPNSRKKSPTGRKSLAGAQQSMSGTCSTCSVTFANAQEFYEHLDDCVLRVVQQADPSEAINQRLLTSVAEDKEVTETLDRNGLSNSVEYTIPNYDEEEEDDEEDMEADDANDDTYGSRRSRSGKGALKGTKTN